MSLFAKDKNGYSKVLTELNWTDLIFSKSIKTIDQNTDLNDLNQGIYQIWGGSNPKNAPDGIIPWARYYVVPFFNNDNPSSETFVVAFDVNGSIFVRAKGGYPLNWESWYRLATQNDVTALQGRITALENGKPIKASSQDDAVAKSKSSSNEYYW